MNLDIRLPIGALFSALGAVLMIYGLFTNGDPMYAKSLGMNINIMWGGVMLMFGLLMLFYGKRAKPIVMDHNVEGPNVPRGH